MNRLPVVFRLSDGIRGHFFQTEGIRDRMTDLAELECHDLEVPLLEGWTRIMALKVRAWWLPSATKDQAKQWLQKSRGEAMMDAISALDLENRPKLFLSAGGRAAPYCLALARLYGGKSCVVMTPSVLGTDSFDMAVVPKHDGYCAENTLVTMGAPNSISPQRLKEQAQELCCDYPPQRDRAWGILIGGDDQNYVIAPLWVEKVFPQLLEAARQADVDLYITTSRRTRPETENVISEFCRGNPRVRMLLLASQDPRNPVPGLLGHCSRVFCTEDSVSMISESVTAGLWVSVLTVGHCHGVRSWMQRITEKMTDAKLISQERLWGVPRFTRMLEEFEALGYLEILSPRRLAEDLSIETPQERGLPPFNEAGRAARWILDRWLGESAQNGSGPNLS